MRIQEEAPLPQSPLATFESDYEMAVVHLAWDRRRGGEDKEPERTLLFAFVELLPNEIPPPNDDYDPRDPRFSERLGGQSEHHVHIRHAVVSAENALSWYLGCRRGLAVLPENGCFPDPEAPNAKRLGLADLGEEPSWPTLLCVADDSDSIPFAPEWAECPRMHQLVSLAEFNLDGLWSKGEQERAKAWLEDRLHFSLEEYAEYWGSVHLMAPNPVFRGIDVRLQKRAPPAQSVLVRFEPRAAKSVDGLELSYRGSSSAGRLYTHTVPVHSALMRMNFGNHAHTFQIDVVDSIRGMLKNTNLMGGFFGGFKLSTHLGGTLEVKGPTPTSTYTVPRTRPVNRHRTMETPKIASAELRLAAASDRRRKRAAAARHDQRWFRGEKEEAQDILRGLLHGAQREVLVVDPYFGHLELWVFTLAVGQEDVPVRVLSSAEVLKELAGRDGQVQGAENGDVTLAQVKRLRSEPHMNPLEIKVMTGDRPIVHDRFLLIDDRIWLLGSSLNEFGSRGTMMVSLPDPEPVREQLTKAWNDAVELETWVERRRKSRSGNGGRGA